MKSKADVREYLSTDLIQCLECRRSFQTLGPHLMPAHGMTPSEYKDAHNLPAGTPLAGRIYRKTHQSKFNRMLADGVIEPDPEKASMAARKKERPARRDFDIRDQAEIAKKIERKQLPPGAKRADGRDADSAREYQRAYRAKRKAAKKARGQ